MVTSGNVFVLSKRQCLLHLGAVQMEWGKAGTEEAKEGHTASYRHRPADPPLSCDYNQSWNLTEAVKGKMSGVWSQGGQISQHLREEGLEDNQNKLSSS